MSSKFEYSPPTSDPHIPDVHNCGCAVCRERDALRAEVERLKREVDYWVNLDAQALEAENERLLALHDATYQSLRDERAENERLRAALEAIIKKGQSGDYMERAPLVGLALEALGRS